MFQRLSTDIFNWILIIGVILLIIEMSFFHGGMIVPALFSGAMVYFGWKNFSQLWGKVIFWIGLMTLFFELLNMLAVRFLIIVGILLFIYHYIIRKDDVTYIKPEPEERDSDELLLKIEPLFDHQFFGEQRTSETPYKWRDINIHSAFGDRVIDLSNTFLPDDTAVISIRHLVGNIEIYVPYEVEVSIHHSSVFGRVNIFDYHHRKLVNQTIAYETEGYQTSYPRVKIITSVISGDIEVRRI
ncbi:MAG TPA: cell wall-active antibiotics response protein LiaF [Cerasibacillus sp.]|uniref:cell wall-active antibiotics response protein LiaF n=1 Tax=Cerasibacillus sp. TaxID=2498711 RepID=UPI002F3FBCBF